jgi:hypothetical protein
MLKVENCVYSSILSYSPSSDESTCSAEIVPRSLRSAEKWICYHEHTLLSKLGRSPPTTWPACVIQECQLSFPYLSSLSYWFRYWFCQFFYQVSGDVKFWFVLFSAMHFILRFPLMFIIVSKGKCVGHKGIEGSKSRLSPVLIKFMLGWISVVSITPLPP